MAFSPSVDWNGEFKERPKGTGSRSLGDDAFRDTKVGFRERFIREHQMTLGTSNDLDGAHKPGSGRSPIQSTAPTVDYAGKTIPDSDDDGYVYYEPGTYSDRQIEFNFSESSAWDNVAVPRPADYEDAIPAANHFTDTAANVHTSTIINWLQTHLAGSFHGYTPASGVIGGVPVLGIHKVDSDTLIFQALEEVIELARSSETAAPAALLMLDTAR